MGTFEGHELESAIRSSVRELMAKYDDDYWQQVHDEREFPWEVWDDLAEHDWLGVNIPEEYGGQGLGMQELITVIEEVGTNGGWSLPNAFNFGPVFCGETLRKYGSEEQKEEWLPRAADGKAIMALGLTEPDAGLNTANADTFAERDGDEFVINGQKIWCSRAAECDRIVVLARTIPKNEVDNLSYGMSVFLVDPENPNVDWDQIPLEGFHERTYNVYFDDVRVHESQMVGDEHEGLYNLFSSLNSERIVVAAVCYVIGKSALERASSYANDREVFDGPIGGHQGIQHPLADAYAGLECAHLMTRKAAVLYDQDAPSEEIGSIANVAKLKAAEAAFDACDAAMQTFGGMSIAKEIPISKMWSYVRHQRVAPVSDEMCLNHIAENQLDLPRSY
jgi:acyl-CoA dehydrogenase